MNVAVVSAEPPFRNASMPTYTVVGIAMVVAGVTCVHAAPSAEINAEKVFPERTILIHRGTVVVPADGPSLAMQLRTETLAAMPAEAGGFSGIWRIGKEDMV